MLHSECIPRFPKHRTSFGQAKEGMYWDEVIEINYIRIRAFSWNATHLGLCYHEICGWAFSGPTDLRMIGGFFWAPEVKARRRCTFFPTATNRHKPASNRLELKKIDTSLQVALGPWCAQPICVVVASRLLARIRHENPRLLCWQR